MGAGALVATGVGLQAYGTYSGYQAAEKEARYQERQKRHNIMVAKEVAKDIKTRGLIDIKRLESDAVRLGAQQVTAFASGNIDISSGVAKQVTEDTARIAAADIIELQHNIARDIWGVEQGIISTSAEAQMEKIRARRLKRAAMISFASAILTGGAQLGFGGGGTNSGTSGLNNPNVAYNLPGGA